MSSAAPSSSGTLSENPRLSEADAIALLRSQWGIEAAGLSELGSLQDQNLLVSTADGTRYVLKVTWQGAAAGLDVQNAAMRYLAAARTGFASPEPVPARGGADIISRDGYDLRLLTWVNGELLADRPYFGLAEAGALGELAGRATRALAGFTHPGAERDLVWDIRESRRFADELAGQVPQAGHRQLIAAAMAGFDDVALAGAALPVQVVHADITEVNTVWTARPDGRWQAVGILDFGDTMSTWRVADLVATVTGIVGHRGVDDALAAAAAVVAGYQAACPLTSAEIDAVWPLTLARCAVNLAVIVIQRELNPASDYADEDAAAAERSLEQALAVPAAVARAAIRHAAGLVPVPAAAELAAWLAAAAPVPVIEHLDPAVPLLDLSADSEAFSCGEWGEPGAVAAVLAAAGVPDGGQAVGRWGESRLTRSGRPAAGPPASLHLGADLFAAAGTPVRAPLAGHACAGADGEVIVALAGPPGAPAWLRLAGIEDGLAAGTQVTAGQLLGTLAARPGGEPPHVHVQLLTAPGLPCYGTTRHRAAWLAVSPDPSPLLGIAAAAPPPADPARRRREREVHVASPQHLYYDQPVEIVRGWRHYLLDADGRPYLDMINNIAAVGHSHPRVTAAAVRQFRRLNTNSRFLYDSMTRYCARIAELLPGLGSVFLVNSGSEAADLALQLASIATGHRDMIALAGAYHGWTGAVLEVCTSPMDRPHWREELGPGVHIAEQPDPYRGRFGDDADAYARSVRDACAAAAQGGGVAAFVTEPLLGNQGAVEPPAGYLAAAYDYVRQAGGLCVADEVQVGMARTGTSFWAFQHEGVQPDIVYTAKATGNGHPLGVVACRPEIAAAFDGRTAYFSSTGGGPVSCEIGLAVLDVLRDERLQENAASVGGYLKKSLASLAQRHELIGAVHGRGLYLGVDLVRDRATKEPAVEEALRVSELLRSLGVIMQPTGDAFNVLKVKPPLCLDREGADFFVAALDRALSFMP
jgi:4-aminobutyrate aminotransferase-like enzyme/Ser/Thr protein kinase RdoA (MazF antagonist)